MSPNRSYRAPSTWRKYTPDLLRAYIALAVVAALLGASQAPAQERWDLYRASIEFYSDKDREAHPRRLIYSLVSRKNSGNVCVNYIRPWTSNANIGRLAATVDVLRREPESGDVIRVSRIRFGKKKLSAEFGRNFRCKGSEGKVEPGDVLVYEFRFSGAPAFEFPEDNYIKIGVIGPG